MFVLSRDSASRQSGRVAQRRSGRVCVLQELWRQWGRYACQRCAFRRKHVAEAGAAAVLEAAAATARSMCAAVGGSKQ